MILRIIGSRDEVQEIASDDLSAKTKSRSLKHGVV